EDYCGAWVRAHLRGYTGMLNIETIGERIIEVHLRFSDQWPDLYGRDWIDALVRLYSEGRWEFADSFRRDAYSIVLFGPHGQRYPHPPPVLLEQARRVLGVSSVQITFFEDKPPDRHSMPPGGFRLAIINSWNLAAGLSAREMLRKYFFEEAM